MKVFCYYCKLSHDSNVGLVSSRADPSFVTTGVCNWKKGMEKFKDHESSLSHKNSLAAIIASKNVPVTNLIQQSLHKEQVQRRERLHKQLTLHFLLHQGVSIRNDHAGGSNIIVLLEHMLDEKLWVKGNKYQSPEIINEIIEIMAHTALHSLLADVNSSPWFSLMADETRDISNREQLVICLRWVSEKYEYLKTW